MRWYFALDEAGAAGQTGADAKTAVLTAAAIGGLEPFLLYHGHRNDFTTWMQRQGVTVIDAAPRFLDIIRRAQSAGTYKPHSIGHWLRVAIPLIETTQDFVLYTDCDIIFLKPANWPSIRPKLFAAAPEFKIDTWNYFNSGVMVLNIQAMRQTYDAFESLITTRIQTGDHPFYDDEWALNEAYRGHWQKLDPTLNWKPCWGFSSTAKILHFHGPKLNAIEPIAAGQWTADNPTANALKTLLTGHKQAYQTWLALLADHLQLLDPAQALRLTTAAAAVKKMPTPENVDLSLLDFRMFPEAV
jgi:hypothetical protein